MKTKFNSNFSTINNDTTRHDSYIQKYLEREIDFLLTPSANQIGQMDFEKIYINNNDLENELEKYSTHTHNNNICVLSGLTGSGKSMLVRHVFKIHSMAPSVHDKNLIIPFNLTSLLFFISTRLF